MFVLNEPNCYHFRVLDPRLPLCWPPANFNGLGDGRDHVGAPVLARLNRSTLSSLAVMLSKTAASVPSRSTSRAVSAWRWSCLRRETD